jgi:nucleoside-diphosphate-sugar epimerase
MKIAITGATGYVGGCLADHLRKDGHDIYGMGRRDSDAIRFRLGENNDYTALSGMDALIHCAYDFAPRKWEDIERINVTGTVELLGQARHCGVNKIILISSMSAYAEARSHYGRAKFEAEERSKALGTVVLRPGTVFGKNAGGIIGTMSRFISKYCCVPMIGCGDQPFYPCHSEDLARITTLLLQEPSTPALPVAATCKQTVTYRQMMLALAEAQQKKMLLIPLPIRCCMRGLPARARSVSVQGCAAPTACLTCAPRTCIPTIVRWIGTGLYSAL